MRLRYLSLGPGIALLACFNPPAADSTSGDTEQTSAPTGGNTVVTAEGTGDPTTADSSDAGDPLMPSMTNPVDSTGDEAESGPTGSSGETTEGDPDYDYVDDVTDPDAYARVDRIGFPAMSTLYVATADKDMYNNMSPQDDVNGGLITPMVNTVNFWFNALDDELSALGLVQCPNPSACLQQILPFISPDALVLEPSAPGVFPNGRRLHEPAFDMMFAYLILDLVPPPPSDQQDSMSLTQIPLNPTSNDVSFPNDFPWVAPPH